MRKRVYLNGVLVWFLGWICFESGVGNLFVVILIGVLVLFLLKDSILSNFVFWFWVGFEGGGGFDIGVEFMLVCEVDFVFGVCWLIWLSLIVGLVMEVFEVFLRVILVVLLLVFIEGDDVWSCMFLKRLFKFMFWREGGGGVGFGFWGDDVVVVDLFGGGEVVVLSIWNNFVWWFMFVVKKG